MEREREKDTEPERDRYTATRKTEKNLQKIKHSILFRNFNYSFKALFLWNLELKFYTEKLITRKSQ